MRVKTPTKATAYPKDVPPISSESV